jgi:hypothetical protein
VFEAVGDDEDLHPSDALYAYLRAYRGGGGSLEVLAQALARASLPDVLRALRVTRTPAILLHAAEALLHRMHDWGTISLRNLTSAGATATLEAPPQFAPDTCRCFAGVLVALLGLAGQRATVKHVSCMAEGARACEVEIAWASARSALEPR